MKKIRRVFINDFLPDDFLLQIANVLLFFHVIRRFIEQVDKVADGIEPLRARRQSLIVIAYEAPAPPRLNANDVLFVFAKIKKKKINDKYGAEK